MFKALFDKYEEHMAAASFAEAGEFDFAIAMIDEAKSDNAASSGKNIKKPAFPKAKGAAPASR